MFGPPRISSKAARIASVIHDDANDDTEPCPYCGVAVYEDAERCPHCENYLSREDAPPTRRPLWIVVGVVICLAIVLKWIGVW
jgi:hypothetical protein